MSGEGSGTSSGFGPATDRYNEPVIDPTKNVLDLVQAAISRQDDLRRVNDDHLRDLINLRAKERKHEFKQIAVVAELRAEYEDKLRTKEADRIDAIRAVDVAAAAEARATAETRAATLAASVETQRVTTAQALDDKVAPIVKSISDLTAAMYAQQGAKSAQTESHTERNAMTGNVIATIGLVVIVIAAIMGFLASHYH